MTQLLGTVLERDGAVYRVATAAGEVRAVLRGKAKRGSSRVVVGDRVQLEPEPTGEVYGVRRDLQESLRQAGYRLRIYIPFGTQWYPYLMRRLAERPANIAFILGNLVRESVPRR